MNEKFYTRSRTIVSFTIAFLTLFSGLLGWQMGNISRVAESEYSKAQRAELNRQKISSTNALKAYEDYRAFLVYKNYFEQYKLVAVQLEKARKSDTPDEKLITQLTTKREELESLYLSSLRLFPNQFINRDGTYNLQEELGQLNASEERKVDTTPDTFERRGEQYDIQVGKMQIALILLAVSLFFFAIVSTVEGLRTAILLIFILSGYSAASVGVAMGVSNWNPVLAAEQTVASLPGQTDPTSPVVAIAAVTQPILATHTPVPTSLPSETTTPTRVAPPPTKTQTILPPEAPFIQDWTFVCSAAKKEMRITIEWPDSDDNESGYRVLRDGEVAVDLPADTTSYIDSIPLVSGVKVRYKIEAFNAGGSSFSKEISYNC